LLLLQVLLLPLPLLLLLLPLLMLLLLLLLLQLDIRHHSGPKHSPKLCSESLHSFCTSMDRHADCWVA
jgi:hypothetical protein